MAQQYKKNDIELNQVLIVNHNKRTLNIKEMTQSIDIYLDLEGNGIYADILVSDANGLPELIPVVGDEIIVIRFRTPTFKKMREFVLKITNISSRQKAAQRSDAFIVHACSAEIVNSELKSVKRSYKDLSADKIIRGIYDEFLKPLEEDHTFVKKSKKLFLQESAQNLNFNFPGEKPFNAINMAIREGRVKTDAVINEIDYDNVVIASNPVNDPNESSNFVFYESYDGWYLRTIDTLMSTEPVDDFFLVDSSMEQPKREPSIKAHQYVQSFEIVKQVDNLENVQNGQYSHDVETLDPIFKRFTEVSFNIEKGKAAMNSLEKNKDGVMRPLNTEGSLYRRDNLKSTYKYFLPSNIGNPRDVLYVEDRVHKPFEQNGVETDQQLRNPRRLHEFISYDIVSRKKLQNIVLSVEIPGNSDIDIGDVINLHFPQQSQNQEFIKKLNVLLDKKFFVTGIRHVINKQDSNYTTVIECVKDSYHKDPKEIRRE